LGRNINSCIKKAGEIAPAFIIEIPEGFPNPSAKSCGLCRWVFRAFLLFGSFILKEAVTAKSAQGVIFHRTYR
jgi:hypothetical protein